MANITVRKMDFLFPGDLPLVADPNDPGRSAMMLGLSFTLPHLEPYLIRTMRQAVKRATHPTIANDMRNFSAQEGYHYRNHAKINDILLSKMKPETAEKMRAIEEELEADFQDYSKTKSLRYNLAYAEGFEAMTLIMALKGLEDGYDAWDENWAKLFEWHMAEEIEHRNVTFDAYHHLFGSYLYRVYIGYKSQKHFLSYVARFAKCASADFDIPEPEETVLRTEAQKEKLKAEKVAAAKAEQEEFNRQLMRTHAFRYNPSKVPIPEIHKEVLAKYDKIVAEQLAAPHG